MNDHEIIVSVTTFQRLQKHAQPFIDTPEEVINRALDALEKAEGGAIPTKSHLPLEVERRIDPKVLPRLTHTKVLSAEIDGKVVERPNWNHLLDEMLRVAQRRLKNFNDLRNQCPANLVQGRKETDGFAYLEDIDLSVQRQDANSACRTIVTLALRLGISLDIGFIWRPKEDALYPGEHGRIRIAGSQTL